MQKRRLANLLVPPFCTLTVTSFLVAVFLLLSISTFARTPADTTNSKSPATVSGKPVTEIPTLSAPQSQNTAPACVAAQSSAARTTVSPHTAAAPPKPVSMDLDTVMSKLDQTAANFHAAEANFTWTTFNSVVSDTFKQTGKIYFERSGNDVKMFAEIAPPDAEQVLFSGGKIELYKQKMRTVDTYNAGAHREEAETLLVLGFGSSGDEMRKSFDVKYDGQEKIDGVDTAKLELTPKSESVKNNFPQIILWIDLQRGVSLQQKLMETSGDYRLANYSNIQLRQKIPDKVFRLKTSGAITTVNH